MREIDGIVYPDKPENEIKVSSVKALSDLMMLVTFTTGEKRLYDATQLLQYPAFTKLTDETVFCNPVIDHGVITWDEGKIDIAPETVYANSFPYNEQDIVNA